MSPVSNYLRKCFCLLLSAGLLLLSSGCGTFRHLKYPFKHTYSKVSGQNRGITPEFPASYTVYPFRNFSWEKSAALRGQRETAMAFSLAGRVAPLNETLEMASREYSFEDAIKVARRQKSDAVILGEVLQEDSIFLILASYSYVEVKLSIYNVSTGEILWTGTTWAATGDMASILYLVPIPAAAWFKHMYWSKIMNDLYHRIALNTVYTLRPEVLEFEP